MLPKITYARVTTALAATLALAAATVALAGGGGNNAATLDGTHVKRFVFSADAGDGSKTILKAGDLRMKAQCHGNGSLSANVSTTSNNASYHSYGYSSDDSLYDFDKGTPHDLSIGGERDAFYKPDHGDTVALQYLTLEGGKHDCTITGFAFIGAGPSGTGDAASVGGTHLKTIKYTANEGSNPRTILNEDGLRLRAECNSGPALTLRATTSSNNASYADYPNTENFPDFDTTDSADIDPDNEQDIVYRNASGHTVAVQLLGSDEADSHDCIASGIAWVK